MTNYGMLFYYKLGQIYNKFKQIIVLREPLLQIGFISSKRGSYYRLLQDTIHIPSFYETISYLMKIL